MSKPIAELTPTEVARFWSKVDVGHHLHCWAWTGGADPDGYGVMKVGGRFVGAHRIAYALHNDYDNPQCVLHDCDNARCVNPRHLKGGTQQQNIQEMHKRGRAASTKGSDNGHSKLNESKVRDIKQLLKAGKKPYQIAPLFGVHRSTVSDINTGRTWSHVR